MKREREREKTQLGQNCKNIVIIIYNKKITTYTYEASKEVSHKIPNNALRTHTHHQVIWKQLVIQKFWFHEQGQTCELLNSWSSLLILSWILPHHSSPLQGYAAFFLLQQSKYAYFPFGKVLETRFHPLSFMLTDTGGASRYISFGGRLIVSLGTMLYLATTWIRALVCRARCTTSRFVR